MSNFLLLAILFCILGVVIMIIYLADKISMLEKNTRAATGEHAPAANPQSAPDKRFAGLSGERLWQAMSGAAVAGLDTANIDDIRKYYGPALERHIDELFEEGLLDSRQGIQVQPDPLRNIRTTQGQLLSWLPPGEAKNIYDLGRDRGRGEDANLPELRARLDATCARVYSMLGLTPAQSFSQRLLPGPVQTTAGASVLAQTSGQTTTRPLA
jgi:hypothetical protein